MSDQPSDQPSDRQGAGPLPELTPEQESEVRRRLADARHDEPIPTAVADRLDSVLAGLTRDEPGSPGVAPVIDLAARRRRRNAAALLAGAAAVIVAGFVGGQVIDVGSDGDSADQASTGAAADREVPEKGELGSDAAGSGQALNPSPDAPAPPTDAGADTVLQLRSSHLAKDVRDQLSDYSATSDSGESAGGFAAVGCPPPPAADKFGLGDLFPALYDDTPAVLALRPPANGQRQADVLDCTTASVLASVTVPSR